jgi:hypothetical protein
MSAPLAHRIEPLDSRGKSVKRPQSRGPTSCRIRLIFFRFFFSSGFLTVLSRFFTCASTHKVFFFVFSNFNLRYVSPSVAWMRTDPSVELHVVFCDVQPPSASGFASASHLLVSRRTAAGFEAVSFTATTREPTGRHWHSWVECEAFWERSPCGPVSAFWRAPVRYGRLSRL